VDTTLGKYKPQVEGAPQSGIELLSLWDKYAAFKMPRLAPPTKNTFDRYRSYISRFPSQDPGDAVQIRDWIASTLTPDSGARLLTNLSAACKWGVKSELLEGDPFQGMAGDIRVRKDDDDEFDIRPFRLAEQEAILRGFEQSKYYRHYAAMIRFFLWTGCRPSEGIALQ
jgi:integrase